MVVNKWAGREVILIRETLLKSIARDLCSLVMFAVMIGLGVFLQSEAMQWVAGILFCFWVIGRAGNALDNGIMTIDQARDRLDELERGRDDDAG